MKGSRYLLPALLKTLICPPLIIYITLQLVDVPRWLHAALYILSFPVLYVLRSELSLLQSNRRARQLGCQPIPRVRGRWPLNIDVLLDWARSGEEEAGYMIREMEKTYGRTFNTRVLGEDQIITSDPKVMRQVLVDQFENFVKGDKFQERAKYFLGDGIFNSDGDRWKFHRSLTRPFFHPSHVNASTFAPLISRFTEDLPTTQPFDIQARLQLLTTQMSLHWICGENILPEQARVVGKALSEAQRVVSRRVKIGTVWPLFELFRDPLTSPMRVLHAFMRPCIERARQRLLKWMAAGESNTKTLHLVDRLVESTADDKLVCDQLINIFLASQDTTSSLLTFCVYSLCEYQTVASRVREEILAVAGGEKEVTKEMIRDCKYTRNFINEVLRIYPPVPLNIRRSIRHSALPTSDGKRLYMPANTSIILSTIVMHTSPGAWGSSAKKFEPERWAEMGEERENFMSWHLGPRMPFALTVAHTFLILLFRRLEAESLQLRHVPNSSADTADEQQVRQRRARKIKADVVLAIGGGLCVEIS